MIAFSFFLWLNSEIPHMWGLPVLGSRHFLQHRLGILPASHKADIVEESSHPGIAWHHPIPGKHMGEGTCSLRRDSVIMQACVEKRLLEWLCSGVTMGWAKGSDFLGKPGSATRILQKPYLGFIAHVLAPSPTAIESHPSLSAVALAFEFVLNHGIPGLQPGSGSLEISGVKF